MCKQKKTTLVPNGSRHIAYKGGVRANVQIANSNMQMLGAWAFGLVCVKVGTI
jgi:hypothetical protein